MHIHEAPTPLFVESCDEINYSHLPPKLSIEMVQQWGFRDLYFYQIPARTCFMGSPLTLSSTTSLMGGSPSGFWIQAGMNWISSRNSRSYCFFPSGSRGFHCSIGREVPESHRKQTLCPPRCGSVKSKGMRMLHQPGKFQFNLIFILKWERRATHKTLKGHEQWGVCGARSRASIPGSGH